MRNGTRIRPSGSKCKTAAPPQGGSSPRASPFFLKRNGSEGGANPCRLRQYFLARETCRGESALIY